jgi:hypothetical protein
VGIVVLECKLENGVKLFSLTHLLSLGYCFTGNPRVTPEVTRDVCLLARLMTANLYFAQIEDLMFEVGQRKTLSSFVLQAAVMGNPRSKICLNNIFYQG